MHLWGLMGSPHVAVGQQPLLPAWGGAWSPWEAEDGAEYASTLNT